MIFKKLERSALYIFYAAAALTQTLPLWLDNRFFFPFITTKAFAFRILVAVMALAYLALATADEKYRPRRSVLLGLFTAFVAAAALSSALGGDFRASFWGDMERSEGLLLWLHLLAYLAMLIWTVRSEKAWMRLLDASLAIGLLTGLYGLGQALHWKVLLATSGSRVDATIGNAAFFAAYLLFQLAFAAYLFYKRTTIGARIYYGALILLFVGLIFSTQTRGMAIGLAAGVLVSAFLLFIFASGSRKTKTAAAALTILVLAAAGSLYLARESRFVQNSGTLRRVVSISTQERTAQTRLATWQAAWQGWKERFMFGYGLENFDIVFNKHFPPIIYEDEGSQVWFDRAHNLIFDRGVTTGVVGLALYLAFLLYPLWRLIGIMRRDRENRIPAAIFAGFIVAFLIQDMFVFESITTYVFLVFAWSFMGFRFPPAKAERQFTFPRWAYASVAVVFAVLFIPLVWYVTLNPARINVAAAKAMRADPKQDNFFTAVDEFKKALDTSTYGLAEYRVQYIDFVDQQLASVGEVVPQVRPVLEYTESQLDSLLSDNPRNAKNFLLAMRHYNYTYASYADKKIERLERALSYYPRLHELSPTRPQVEQEAGYTHLYLYRLYKQENNAAAAAEQLAESEKLMRSTIELNPAVVESYISLIMVWLNSGDDQKIQSLVEEMDSRQVKYREDRYLSRLVDLSRANGRIRWVGYFSEELTKLYPDNVTGWTSLALFYANSGNRQKAIEIAETYVRPFSAEYAKQVDQFVANVRAGMFEKNSNSK